MGAQGTWGQRRALPAHRLGSRRSLQTPWAPCCPVCPKVLPPAGVLLLTCGMLVPEDSRGHRSNPQSALRGTLRPWGHAWCGSADGPWWAQLLEVSGLLQTGTSGEDLAVTLISQGAASVLSSPMDVEAAEVEALGSGPGLGWQGRASACSAPSPVGGRLPNSWARVGGLDSPQPHVGLVVGHACPGVLWPALGLPLLWQAE